MNGTVRAAQAADVPAMADLAERRRVEYQRFQPTFWRKAADSRARQLPYFERLVGSEDHIALVYERAGAIAGFILGALIPAPPVYDPGGPTCLVDDFTVAAAESWELVGSALLRAVRQRLQAVFEHAKRSAEKADYDYAHDLYSQVEVERAMGVATEGLSKFPDSALLKIELGNTGPSHIRCVESKDDRIVREHQPGG